MDKNRNSLPFYNEYIDELLGEIKEFEKRYLEKTDMGQPSRI